MKDKLAKRTRFDGSVIEGQMGSSPIRVGLVTQASPLVVDIPGVGPDRVTGGNVGTKPKAGDWVLVVKVGASWLVSYVVEEK